MYFFQGLTIIFLMSLGFLIFMLLQTFNSSLLIVTHDTGFAATTDRVIEMEDARIIKQ
jgi:ABC-type lipoprotein export system ATPase subunit